MLATKVESPRVVHHDAIHHTNLLNRVKVNVVKSVEGGGEGINTENEKGQRVSRVNKLGLNTQISRGTIY